MGGGHLTRNAQYTDRPDPNDPMTEFYLIFQSAAENGSGFALPGCWGLFEPPESGKLYADDIADYCSFITRPVEGWKPILAPGRLRVLQSTLKVTAEGVPAALQLIEEATHHVYSVQLLPPFAGAGITVPHMPDGYASLTLQLSAQDIDLADTAPQQLGKALLTRTAGKQWVSHPAMEAWMRRRLELDQRYRRG